MTACKLLCRFAPRAGHVSNLVRGVGAAVRGPAEGNPQPVGRGVTWAVSPAKQNLLTTRRSRSAEIDASAAISFQTQAVSAVFGLAYRVPHHGVWLCRLHATNPAVPPRPRSTRACVRMSRPAAPRRPVCATRAARRRAGAPTAKKRARQGGREGERRPHAGT